MRKSLLSSVDSEKSCWLTTQCFVQYDQIVFRRNVAVSRSGFQPSSVTTASHSANESNTSLILFYLYLKAIKRTLSRQTETLRELKVKYELKVNGCDLQLVKEKWISLFCKQWNLKMHGLFLLFGHAILMLQ